MKKIMFLTVVLALSAVLVGCCGLGNVQQKSSYYTKEMMRTCDDTGCRNQLVEVEKEIRTDAPPSYNGYSNINIATRIGRNGFLAIGANNGYGGYNGYNNSYGYPRPGWGGYNNVPICSVNAIGQPIRCPGTW